MAKQSYVYATLFSNTSRDIYEQNTHDDCTENTFQNLDLCSTSNWEVWVSEISSFPPLTEKETTALM